MSDMAVIGDVNSVLGFKAAGIEVHYAESQKEIQQSWEDALDGNYSIILVTEAIYHKLEEEIESLRDSIRPAIMIIPASTRSEGLGTARLKKVVEKAVGTDLISGEDNGGR